MNPNKTTETDPMITIPVLGVLTYREWHAIIDGLFCGVVTEREYDYSQEQHYWRVGWLIGRYMCTKSDLDVDAPPSTELNQESESESESELNSGSGAGGV